MRKNSMLHFMLLLLLPNVTYTSVPNKPIHWGFKKAVNEQPAEAGAQYDQLLEKYGDILQRRSKLKDPYLTLDSGYENGYTPKILEVLKRKRYLPPFL